MNRKLYNSIIIFFSLSVGYVAGNYVEHYREIPLEDSNHSAKADGTAGYQGEMEFPEVLVDTQNGSGSTAPTINLWITHYRAACDKNTAANEPVVDFLMLALAKRMNLCGIAAVSPGPNPVCKSWYDRVKTGDYPVVEILRDDPGGNITAGRYLICDRTASFIKNTIDIYTGTKDVGYLYAYPSDVREVTE